MHKKIFTFVQQARITDLKNRGEIRCIRTILPVVHAQFSAGKKTIHSYIQWRLIGGIRGRPPWKAKGMSTPL